MLNLDCEPVKAMPKKKTLRLAHHHDRESQSHQKTICGQSSYNQWFSMIIMIIHFSFVGRIAPYWPSLSGICNVNPDESQIHSNRLHAPRSMHNNDNIGLILRLWMLSSKKKKKVKWENNGNKISIINIFHIICSFLQLSCSIKAIHVPAARSEDNFLSHGANRNQKQK